MSDEQTMVERVARAICKAEGMDPDECLVNGLSDWFYRKGEACAAIAAMREPTEAMKRASRITIDIPSPLEGGRIHIWGSNVWPQMIDAALAEP